MKKKAKIKKTMVYVSITGLQLKSMMHYPKFAYLAMQSMIQAQSANGNLQAEARTIDGVHHTLSVWQNKEDMLDYLSRGHHKRALNNFNSIATGKVFGAYFEDVPNWEEALELWQTKGREVY